MDMLWDRFTTQYGEASPMQCNWYSRVTNPIYWNLELIQRLFFQLKLMVQRTSTTIFCSPIDPTYYYWIWQFSIVIICQFCSPRRIGEDECWQHFLFIVLSNIHSLIWWNSCRSHHFMWDPFYLNLNVIVIIKYNIGINVSFNIFDPWKSW